MDGVHNLARGNFVYDPNHNSAYFFCETETGASQWFVYVDAGSGNSKFVESWAE